MKTVEIIYRYSSPGAPTLPRPQDAEAARLRLSDGNHAFATLLDSLSEGAGLARRVIDVDPRDLGLLQGEHSSLPQHPFAVVLGCSDARVPIELIFNEGPNDLFCREGCRQRPWPRRSRKPVVCARTSARKPAARCDPGP